MRLFIVRGRKEIYLLLVLIVLIELGGFISGLLGGTGSMQYLDLNKPSFSPPSWVFPIVWSILYFLMAVALYRVLMAGTQGKSIGKAVAYFVIQLLLNYLWSIIFFRFNLYGIAFIELLAMLIFIILTTIELYKIDKAAAWLMVPYILWVSFAAVLNFFIWMMN